MRAPDSPAEPRGEAGWGQLDTIGGEGDSYAGHNDNEPKLNKYNIAEKYNTAEKYNCEWRRNTWRQHARREAVIRSSNCHLICILGLKTPKTAIEAKKGVVESQTDGAFAAPTFLSLHWLHLMCPELYPKEKPIFIYIFYNHSEI